ncbi:MAG: hypothetical protein GXY83_37480 [Rhodopirellula sp.]|nr:hypothetical protein [Rhodopirellula sp.]
MTELMEDAGEIVACVVLADSETEASERAKRDVRTTECFWCGHCPCGCGG